MSVIELHCRWDDIMFVQSGTGILTHSREIKNVLRLGGSEWRAGVMVQSKAVDLRRGDVVRIAAGEAHQVAPLGDAPLVYFLVKLRSDNDLACAHLPLLGR